MKDVEVYFWAPGLGAGACIDVIDYRANYRVELIGDWLGSHGPSPRLISANPVVITEGPIESIPVGVFGLLWAVRDGRCLDLIPAVVTYKTGADTCPGEVHFRSLGEFVVTSEGPTQGLPSAARVEVTYAAETARGTYTVAADVSVSDAVGHYLGFDFPTGGHVTGIKVALLPMIDGASAPGPDATWHDRPAML